MQRYWGAAWAPVGALFLCQAAARLPFCFQAARDFCGVMVTWRFRHGAFQAPRQGPETPPRWASLWAAGCLPNPEPLSPAGPAACQAAQLRGAEPLASTAPGSQLLCFSSEDCFLGSSDSWTLDFKCLSSALSCLQKPCRVTRCHANPQSPFHHLTG